MKKSARSEKLSQEPNSVEEILEYFSDKLGAADTKKLIRLEAVYVSLMGYILTFDPSRSKPEAVFSVADRFALIKTVAEEIKDLPPQFWDVLIFESVRLMNLAWTGHYEDAVEEIHAVKAEISRLCQTEGRQPPNSYVPPDEKIR